jgi:hypothetical protein
VRRRLVTRVFAPRAKPGAGCVFRSTHRQILSSKSGPPCSIMLRMTWSRGGLPCHRRFRVEAADKTPARCPYIVNVFPDRLRRHGSYRRRCTGSCSRPPASLRRRSKSHARGLAKGPRHAFSVRVSLAPAEESQRQGWLRRSARGSRRPGTRPATRPASQSPRRLPRP